MLWVGYLTLATTALLVGHTLWILLGSRQLRGRPVVDSADLFPWLADPCAKRALYCYREHCGPCRHLTPLMDALRLTNANPYKLDVARYPGTARQLGIQATPTILLIEDGRILKAQVGANGLPALKAFLGGA